MGELRTVGLLRQLHTPYTHTPIHSPTGRAPPFPPSNGTRHRPTTANLCHLRHPSRGPALAPAHSTLAQPPANTVPVCLSTSSAPLVPETSSRISSVVRGGTCPWTTCGEEGGGAKGGEDSERQDVGRLCPHHSKQLERGQRPEAERAGPCVPCSCSKTSSLSRAPYSTFSCTPFSYSTFSCTFSCTASL